jgi:hypothetical protein
MTQPAPVVREWFVERTKGVEHIGAMNDSKPLTLIGAMDEHNRAIRALRAEVEALTKRIEILNACGNAQAASIRAAEAEAAALRKALAQFGKHPQSCASGWAFQPCDCGLSEALKESGFAGAPLIP